MHLCNLNAMLKIVEVVKYKHIKILFSEEILLEAMLPAYTDHDTKLHCGNAEIFSPRVGIQFGWGVWWSWTSNLLLAETETCFHANCLQGFLLWQLSWCTLIPLWFYSLKQITRFRGKENLSLFLTLSRFSLSKSLTFEQVFPQNFNAGSFTAQHLRLFSSSCSALQRWRCSFCGFIPR